MKTLEEVILVDEQDQEIGTMEKMQAHREALLHRAFSVLTFNSKHELLIHRRAIAKYHSGGLWTNTCCSHPRPHETTEAAAHRRLQEEMGFDCNLSEVFSFQYEAFLDQGLTEKEYDHVFFGIYDGVVDPNPEEVMDYRYISLENIKREVTDQPEKFTAWFEIIIKEIDPYLHLLNEHA